MRIGLLGGTFDPPHFGHLNLAEEAKLNLGLDRIFFIPAGQPPHKPRTELTPSLLRYKMTRLAIRNRPNYEVADLELRREPPSYTIDTLRQFRNLYPFPHEIFFLVGADALELIHVWKDLALILEMCRFMIARRPGYPMKSIPEGAMALDIAELDISSDDIRRRIRLGESVNELLPYKFLRFIEKEGLYRS